MAPILRAESVGTHEGCCFPRPFIGGKKLGQQTSILNLKFARSKRDRSCQQLLDVIHFASLRLMRRISKPGHQESLGSRL